MDFHRQPVQEQNTIPAGEPQHSSAPAGVLTLGGGGVDFVVDLRLVEEIIDLSQRSIRIFEGSCGELLASVHGWTIPVVRLWQTKTAAEDRMYGGVGFLVIVRDEDHYAGLFVDRIGKAAAQPGTEHPEGESEGDNFVTVETGASSTPENTGRALFDLDDIEGL